MEQARSLGQIGVMTETPTRGPRVNADQVRDVSRLRRSRDDRMISGVAGGIARHLDIDPVIVRVIFGALTLFGGAGLLLYGIAWLTVPEDGAHDSAASELLRRNPDSVMLVGIILAALVAGTTMLGALFFSAPNPWPMLVFGALAVLAIVLLTRRQEPLPPPIGTPDGVTPSPQGTPAAAAATGSEGTSAATAGRSDSATIADGPGTGPDVSDPPAAPPPPGDPTAQFPAVPPTPPPPPPRPPRRPISPLVPVTLCLVLLAEAVIWVLDVGFDVDVLPSVYPGTALGIIAVGLIVGAWYGRARLLILFGVIAGLATLASTILGPGPYGEQTFAPRTAAEVADRYEHGVGQLTLHLEDVADIRELDGRAIEIESRVGQVTIYVPGSIDATIDAEVTGGGDITGVPSVDNDGGGSAVASFTPTDDADPDVTLDVRLKLGQIKFIDVLCPDEGRATSPSRPDTEQGARYVPAACN